MSTQYLTPGLTFADGVTYPAASVNAALASTSPTTDFVKSWSVKSVPAGGDVFLIYDLVGNALKSTTLANIQSVIQSNVLTQSNVLSVLPASLSVIGGLNAATDTIPYYTGTASGTVTGFTATGRSIVSATSMGAVESLFTFQKARARSTAATSSGTVAVRVQYDTVDFDSASAITTGTAWAYTFNQTAYFHVDALVTIQCPVSPVSNLTFTHNLVYDGSVIGTIATVLTSSAQSSQGQIALPISMIISATSGKTIYSTFYVDADTNYNLKANGNMNFICITRLP